MDPEDTKVLDNVVRFIGQKVAAVVAETEAAAEEGCRRLKVEYELLPAVVIPRRRSRRARRIHGDKTLAHRISNSARNIVAETHGEFGDVADSLGRRRSVTYQGTFTTQRVQHAAAGDPWRHCLVDADGGDRSHLDAGTVFDAAARWLNLFNLKPDKCGCSANESAAGFGGKQGNVRRGHSGAGCA